MAGKNSDYANGGPNGGPPEGLQEYMIGHCPGQTVYHLVGGEPFNVVALCGKRVYPESLTDYWGERRRMCLRCLAAAAIKIVTKASGEGE